MKNDFEIEIAMKRIEEINSLLTAGELTVNESLKLYKEAVELLKKCDKALDEAKLSVEQIDGASGDEQ